MRSPRCTICQKLHLDVLNKIDERLRNGEAVYGLAREYNVSRYALDRHKKNGHHLESPPREPRAVDDEVMVEVKESPGSSKVPQSLGLEDVIQMVTQILLDLKWTITEIHLKGGSSRENRENMKVFNQTVTSLGKLKGWLSDGSTQVTVQLQSQIAVVGQELLDAIQDCPQCRCRVIAVLSKHDQDDVIEVEPETYRKSILPANLAAEECEMQRLSATGGANEREV